MKDIISFITFDIDPKAAMGQQFKICAIAFVTMAILRAIVYTVFSFSNEAQTNQKKDHSFIYSPLAILLFHSLEMGVSYEFAKWPVLGIILVVAVTAWGVWQINRFDINEIGNFKTAPIRAQELILNLKVIQAALIILLGGIFVYNIIALPYQPKAVKETYIDENGLTVNVLNDGTKFIDLNERID